MNTKTNVTQDAAVRLMLKFPYWSELYYTMTTYEDKAIPTLCTDGRNMWVNPVFWVSLTLELKIAALAHEVGHKMLLHCSRRGHRDPYLWNVAADYAVNGILAENGFTLGKDWLYSDEYLGWSVEAVYADLESKAKKNYGQAQGAGDESEEGEQGGESQEEGDSQGEQESDGEAEGGDSGDDGGGAGDGADAGDEEGTEDGGASGAAGNSSRGQQKSGQSGGQGNSVTYDVPGVPKDWADKWQDIRDMQGDKETVERAEKEVLEAVEKAIMAARAHGSAPAGMDGFEGLLKPSKEPWYNHLHRYMQSLTMNEYNWARINRRHLVQHKVFTPANFCESIENAVFLIDCSGSVFDAASQANFAGHVNAILAETKPKRTHVVYFDSRVARHDELDYGCLDFESRPKGGGGTDFRPCFEFLEEEGIVPDVCIVLTDCYGDFPRDEPPYPVLWASIIDPAQLGHYHPPFGEVIHVEN